VLLIMLAMLFFWPKLVTSRGPAARCLCTSRHTSSIWSRRDYCRGFYIP